MKISVNLLYTLLEHFVMPSLKKLHILCYEVSNRRGRVKGAIPGSNLVCCSVIALKTLNKNKRNVTYRNRSRNTEHSDVGSHYEDNLAKLRNGLILSFLKPISSYILTAAVNIYHHQQQVAWNSFSFFPFHGYWSFHPLLGRTTFCLPVGRFSCTSLVIRDA